MSAHSLEFSEIQTIFTPNDTVDFIADLHLQSTDLPTYQAFERYLQTTPASTLFILGDLFEVWVGDDVLELEPDCFEALACKQLRLAAASKKIYFMHGNRDFLIGQGFADWTGIELLQDPTVVTLGAQKVLLSHGDALCLADEEYQKFRLVSRNSAWQQQLLQQPIAVRRQIAQGARKESESRKSAGADVYADLDTAATIDWLKQTNTRTLLHGHTHKPAEHDLGGGFKRIVMSDWDLLAHPARAEIMRYANNHLQRIRLEAIETGV